MFLWEENDQNTSYKCMFRLFSRVKSQTSIHHNSIELCHKRFCLRWPTYSLLAINQNTAKCSRPSLLCNLT